MSNHFSSLLFCLIQMCILGFMAPSFFHTGPGPRSRPRSALWRNTAKERHLDNVQFSPYILCSNDLSHIHPSLCKTSETYLSNTELAMNTLFRARILRNPNLEGEWSLFKEQFLQLKQHLSLKHFKVDHSLTTLSGQSFPHHHHPRQDQRIAWRFFNIYLVKQKRSLKRSFETSKMSGFAAPTESPVTATASTCRSFKWGEGWVLDTISL